MTKYAKYSFHFTFSAKQLAIGHLQTNSFEFGTAQGLGEGNYKLRPGMRVTLKMTGELSDGEYIADVVTHNFDYKSGYTTGFKLKRNMLPGEPRKISDTQQRQGAESIGRSSQQGFQMTLAGYNEQDERNSDQGIDNTQIEDKNTESADISIQKKGDIKSTEEKTQIVYVLSYKVKMEDKRGYGNPGDIRHYDTYSISYSEEKFYFLDENTLRKLYINYYNRQLKNVTLNMSQISINKLSADIKARLSKTKVLQTHIDNKTNEETIVGEITL